MHAGEVGDVGLARQLLGLVPAAADNLKMTGFALQAHLRRRAAGHVECLLAATEQCQPTVVLHQVQQVAVRLK